MAKKTPVSSTKKTLPKTSDVRTRPIQPPIPPKPSTVRVLPRPTTLSWPARLASALRRLMPLLWVALIGFVVGVFWVIALRFLLVKTPETHYHANFAVYVNGVREEFKGFQYYEEIAACTADYANNPKGRVHMHDSVNDVVHVHDKRVMWSNFFENINWAVGKNFLLTDQGMYQPDQAHELTFVLNGTRVQRIDNRIIGDQDKLLISYGDPATNFMSQYATIENEAAHYDEQQDPASCSGLNGPGHAGFTERLKRAIGLPES